MKTVILASASPRRLQLLSAIGFAVQVEAPFVNEDPLLNEDPKSMVIRLAQLKASTIANAISNTIINKKSMALPIIAADTVVCLENHVLGKPQDNADAVRMLRLLSGKEHEVITGYSVGLGQQQKTGYVITRVRFRDLSLEEIMAYVDTNEPLDKAGSYGIQGYGASLTDHITGSYTNVMGLPLTEVLEALHSLKDEKDLL